MTLHSTDDGGMTDDGGAISFERNGLLSYEGLRNLYMTVVRDPQMVDRTGLALQLVRRSLMIDAEFGCDDGFGSFAAQPASPMASGLIGCGQTSSVSGPQIYVRLKWKAAAFAAIHAASGTPARG